MLIVDVLAGLAVLGFLALVGALGIHVYLNSPKRLGSKNTKQYLLSQGSICPMCALPTTPRLDLLVYGAWFHRHCFDQIQKEIK